VFEELQMGAWARLVASVVFLLSGLAAFSWSGPRRLSAWRVEWPRLSSAEEGEREANLAYRGEVVKRRLEAKRKIIRLLLEGRFTLFQAAALFGYLNDAPEDCPDLYRLRWPGRSDGEKLCRQVIGWVESDKARTASTELDLLREQLDNELEEHMRANGGLVVLPDM
jgi:hypothetical protein